MPSARIYISYSELFDRRPSMDELHELLKSLNAFNTVILLSRIYTILRNAALSQDQQASAAFQRWFAMAFLDQNTRQRIEARLGAQNPEWRPVCYPLQLLNIIRLSLLVSQGGDDARPDTSEIHTHKLGAACLMMNDLFTTPEEARELRAGAGDETRKQLMVQSLAEFELSNPTKLRNLLFRSHAIYQIALRDDELLKRIDKECGGLNIETEFERITGVPLMNWLSLVFGVHTAMATPSQEDFLNKPEVFIMNRKTFIANAAIQQVHIDRFFDSLSMDFSDLRSEVQKGRPVDERFDLVPFKSRPLLKTAEDNYACIDFSLLTEKLHTGPYFLLNSELPEQDRGKIQKAWGLIFEVYVNWLLKGLDGRHSAMFYPDTCWEDGNKTFDAVFVKKRVFVAVEYKGGFLRQQARYSNDVAAFTKDLDDKVASGCKQLARDIAALFPAQGPAKRLRNVPVPTNAFCVLPVLIVQDSIFRVPFVNYFRNKRFQVERERFPTIQRLKVLPLNVVQVTQLETLVEMAEVFDLDLLSTLHRRCVEDEVMGSDLQDFISQLPESRRMRCSKRFDEMMNKGYEKMCKVLFGPSYKALTGKTSN